MPGGRGLTIDGPTELEAIDDRAGPEIEVFFDELADRFVRDAPRPERLDVQRDRLRAADDVRELDLEAIGESRRDDVLRDVARGVRRGAVDLRGVLTAERAAPVPRVAAIGVDDDLATGEAGVAHWSTDRERAGAVHQVFRRG